MWWLDLLISSGAQGGSHLGWTIGKVIKMEPHYISAPKKLGAINAKNV